MDINFKSIAEAMEDTRHYDEFYLNTQNGSVIRISRDVLEAVEDDDPESLTGTPKEEVSLADSILFDPKSPLLMIPNLPFSELMHLMTDFASKHNLTSLGAQITSSGNPSKKFIDALQSHEAERNKWIEFKDSHYIEEARKWAASLKLN